MPFTASHIMAVLPAMRWQRALRLDATCLAVGSMSPDFQYFLWARREGEFSHSLVGLFAFCLPISLVVAYVFHRRVKWLVLALVPAAIARRLSPIAARAWPTAHPISLVVSVLLGAATHLFWDSFTHGPGAMLWQIPTLSEWWEVPVLGTIPGHRVLQHVSTLVGGAVVALVALRAVVRQKSSMIDTRVPRVWLVAIACVALPMAALMFRLWRKHWLETGNVVVVMIAATLAGVVLASLVLRRSLDAIRASHQTLDRT